MSLRALARRSWIESLTALRIDAIARRRMARSAAPVVRIILAHGTPRSSADAFRRQLEWARRHFDLISFEKFKQLWDEPPARRERPAVLFTFDDGMASNYHVGAPLLEEFGVRGVFFVVPQFSLIAGPEARRYYRERLKGAEDTDAEPMTPQQIRELADRGHTIGNHTYTHARLSETPPEELSREILESASVIESWTNRPVETFAWTFYWNAITDQAFKLVRERHRFCFSPCPGLVNAGADSPSLLWRTNVEPWASPSLYRFMYSGLGDRIWAKRREQLASTLQR